MQGVCNSEPLTFRVFGTPVPWARAGRNGKRSYTPASVERWKRQIRFACSQAVEASGWKKVESGPLSLSVAFYMPKPKKPVGLLAATRGRNDIDNLVKAVMDAVNDANASPWADDGLVVMLAACKWWAEEGEQGVSVTIRMAA